MLYLAGAGVIEKLSIAKEMITLESLADVSAKIGALVHELQKERGMERLFYWQQDQQICWRITAATR